MKTRLVPHRIGPALLAGGMFLTGSALADNLPTITIGAGVTTHSVIGYSSSGIPTEQVTVMHRVSYADLDLKTQAGAAELKKRVAETARVACKQLDELYPLEEKKAPECATTAIAAASSQVDDAIAAARREAKAE